MKHINQKACVFKIFSVKEKYVSFTLASFDKINAFIINQL